jgi:huntingtin-interacting protein 1-related protein
VQLPSKSEKMLTSAIQVEILQLENNLAAARQRLGEMRKVSYQE